MRDLLIRAGLLFEAARDEERFVRSFIRHDLRITRAAMLLGAFVYYIFALWDWTIDRAGWGTTHLVRVSVILAVLLPATALTLLPAAQRRLEWLLLAYCVVPAVCLSLIFAMLEHGFAYGAAGMLIIVLFVATLLPMRSPYFALFCLAAWVSFAICEALSAPERPGLPFVNNFVIGTSVTLAMYSVAAREIQARRQFRTATELREEKRRAEATLSTLRQTQASLIQAEKLASLGQLVAGVAHEINTPIGVAVMTSTAIEADVRRIAQSLESGRILRSELTASVGRITEGSRLLFSNLNRAADLVHSFKQVAVDQATGDRRSFAVAGWLHELLSSLGPLVRRKGHAVEVACPEGIVLESYPGALAQVLSNLILNAVVHAYPDGRHGLLRLTVAAEGEDGLRIVFSDDGRGIPPEHLGKVFDPFFTTRRGEGSTGLGLNIVYNLVATTLNGRIAVESEPGAGTRFTIDLPLAAGAEKPA
ncbi:sensor histidine kinase [Methylobacterium trifolii]|uniref:histidine kinase n=1 Tax=Methylobacterium trifolii TaxID=1003092 RepID=A0ABQ4TSV9_9HYPH|nr:HAMP domain-containing sensor histidine kinase [Methylobacterium trifolii]GJE58408.1 Sensor histidine kinase RcsC [Methylobacterium trifolii]